MHVNQPINIEHAESLEAMGERLAEIAKEYAEQRCMIHSVSHTIDNDDPAGRHVFVVIGRSFDL